jgi:hypothetical protein
MDHHLQRVSWRSVHRPGASLGMGPFSTSMRHWSQR